uniref:neurogenic locus notch homolog protein 1-like n=1 Tax=Styela clava TaxID=7725 RepID=UPI0019395187|nr:neurogenic locus notch homolog protein 1-like [Styela clava]
MCPDGRTNQYCEPCGGTCDSLDLGYFKALQNGYPAPCPLICLTGYYCSCPEGYMQRSENDIECVKISTCIAEAQAKMCPAGSTYSDCEPCEGTCDNPNMEGENSPCTLQCKFGDYCSCPEGQMQKSPNERICVPKAECIEAKKKEMCPAGSTYSNCEPCEGTCDNPNMKRENSPCTLQCKFGDYCSCPEGQMQKSPNERICVPKAECIEAKKKEMCPAGSTYSDCEPCEGTCDNPNMEGENSPCTLQCKFGNYCSCPEGQMQKSPNERICVPKAECIEAKKKEMMEHLELYNCNEKEKRGHCTREFDPVCVATGFSEDGEILFKSEANKCMHCALSETYRFYKGSCQ